MLNNDELRLEIAKEDLAKTYKTLKITAGATATMAAVKGGLIVVPKALTFLKGSVVFMGCLPIPNYFSILAGGLMAVETFAQLMAYKARIKEEKIKNKEFSMDELFNLEDEDD
jgi:hypothetical protein